ncbi:hypothetical protein Mal4_11750 [Maioricimonas rarisocia]|uniref:Uncharacterized protein n=1 Tax=Maioricimonas rarisocia TaxID=2528026 RepID=A0A517Z2Z6_9PLAN|nr:hypothetical protein [Maioricimonas rarisocia]QDU36874.1 hypothetical protein Mal4_11750 [Maioricimonas rarisocia]
MTSSGNSSRGRVPGKRFTRTRLIQPDRYVVAVDVEMFVPVEDPSEPCYEAETVRFLKQVQEHAEADDLDWLRRHGKVYQAIEAV